MKNRKWMILILAAALSVSLAACGEAETADTQEPTESTTEEQAEPAAQEDAAEPADTTSGEVGDYTVSIGDCAFTTDYEGNKAIVISYDFTNNSDETVTPLWSLDTTAFQDGISLEVAITMDDSVYKAETSQKELRPGASMENCQIAYVLDSDSPVEFEIGPLFGDPVLTKTFEVQ